MHGYRTLRVLFVALEYTTWAEGASLPYNAMLGLEEGLSAVGVEPLILTTPWLPRARRICADREFDQVWIEIGRQNICDRDWLDWLAGLAPVRLGLLVDSLSYTAAEAAETPVLASRRDGIDLRLGYMTHVLAADECDLQTLATNANLTAAWWPLSVPRRCLADSGNSPIGQPALVVDTVDRRGAEILRHPALDGRIGILEQPESDTIYPDLFNALNASAEAFASGTLPDWETSLPAYLDELRSVRRGIFDLAMEGLGIGSAVVNLPHLLRAYASTVFSGMAAGRPVVSWDIPERPRNRALFEENSEILLFDPDRPEQLAEHLGRLQADPGAAKFIAEAALRKIRAFHTTEARVRSILDWLETGEQARLDAA